MYITMKIVRAIAMNSMQITWDFSHCENYIICTALKKSEKREFQQSNSEKNEIRKTVLFSFQNSSQSRFHRISYQPWSQLLLVIRFKNGRTKLISPAKTHFIGFYINAIYYNFFVHMKLTEDQIIHQNITCTVKKACFFVVQSTFTRKW